jgi:hypothetical protein
MGYLRAKDASLGVKTGWNSCCGKAIEMLPLSMVHDSDIIK